MQILTLFFTTYTFIFYIIILLFGLIIGSFLNVVIHRLPIMLKKSWEAECREYLNQPITDKLKSPYNLSIPRSHCPICKNTIPWYHNIPILSFLFLRGKCGFCKTPISLIYPSIEILTALLSVIIAYRFGISEQLIPALIITYSLIALSMIDYQHHLLPDSITLPILWLGLFLNCFNLFISPIAAILGAVFGYLILWIIAHLFLWIRKKQGMANGDFKLLALIGAWLGPYAVFNSLLIAVVLSLLITIPLILLKKIQYENPIPFGPFLAIASWLTLLFGSFFINLFILN